MKFAKFLRATFHKIAPLIAFVKVLTTKRHLLETRSNAYSESCQTSKTELFDKIVSIFAKNAILVSEMVLNTPVYVNGESFTHQLLLENCF